MSWARQRAEERALRVGYVQARQLLALQSKRSTAIRKALKHRLKTL